MDGLSIIVPGHWTPKSVTEHVPIYGMTVCLATGRIETLGGGVHLRRGTGPRAVANDGWMHPDNLMSSVDNGKLVIMVTNQDGHVQCRLADGYVPSFRVLSQKDMAKHQVDRPP